MNNDWIPHIPIYKPGDLIEIGELHFVIEEIIEHKYTDPSYGVNQLEGGYPRHLAMSTREADSKAVKLAENINLETAKLLYVYR